MLLQETRHETSGVAYSYAVVSIEVLESARALAATCIVGSAESLDACLRAFAASVKRIGQSTSRPCKRFSRMHGKHLVLRNTPHALLQLPTLSDITGRSDDMPTAGIESVVQEFVLETILPLCDNKMAGTKAGYGRSLYHFNEFARELSLDADYRKSTMRDLVRSLLFAHVHDAPVRQR